MNLTSFLFKLPNLEYVLIAAWERTNTVNWYHKEWGAAVKITKNVEVTLELGNRQRLEQFGGLEEDRKMWESLELPRDLLNDFDQNADSDMDNEIHAEMVSDGHGNLLQTGAKVTATILYQKDWWHLDPALEICGTSNLREII